MFFKSIFQGNFHFGNTKSYDKVLRMFDHRIENYYKGDIVFKAEEVFKTGAVSMEIPRTVINITEKTWKNTVDLLQYVSQFAVAGNVGAWMTEEGTIRRYAWIEPKGDKAVVQKYQAAISLVDEGKEEEAMKELTKAIELYDKHAQAYERRGYVNYILKKYTDAERDFSKSVALDRSNSPAYYGRARIKMMREEWSGAIDDLKMAIKTSLALQDIHWSARRLKGECHMKLEQFKEAEFEFRFFNGRQFRSSSPNSAYKRWSLYNYGKVMIALEKYADALEIFDKVLGMPKGQDQISDAEVLLKRGIARKNAGKNGFMSDWNEAKKLGSDQASKLLEACT